jgi:uncharacterized protein YjiK
MKNKSYYTISLLASWIGMLNHSIAQGFELPFNLEQPVQTMYVDSALREISGLSTVPGDTTLLAAIHDEAGIIYFLKKSDGTITCTIPFKSKGDFEGIEIYNKTAYAVKSDGELFVIDLMDCTNPKTKSHKTGLKKEQDIEGLCINTQTQSLVFVTKQDPKLSSQRIIYSMPLAYTDADTCMMIFQFLPEKMIATTADKKQKNYFSPSGISIDPLTGLYYLLSTASKEIAVFKQEGTLVGLFPLDKTIFAQPEGITFDQNGNLFISNEYKGADKLANIVYFKRK